MGKCIKIRTLLLVGYVHMHTALYCYSEKCACCGADSLSEDGRGKGHRVNTVIDPLHSLTLLFFEHTCILSVEWAYL